jgi:hypothetical protein
MCYLLQTLQCNLQPTSESGLDTAYEGSRPDTNERYTFTDKGATQSFQTAQTTKAFVLVTSEALFCLAAVGFEKIQGKTFDSRSCNLVDGCSEFN